MSSSDRKQTEGRKRNAAQPLGESTGLQSKAATERAGKEARRLAGRSNQQKPNPGGAAN